MASFFVEEIGKGQYSVPSPKGNWFRLTLRVDVKDYEGAMKAMKEKLDKNNQISFPRLLKVLASVHVSH